MKIAVPPDRQRVYREAIVKFRYWLRETGKTACAEVFKEHLDWKKSYLAPERFAIRQEALRWYSREGRNRMAGQDVPLSNRDTLVDRTQGQGKGSERKTTPALAQDTSQGLLSHKANGTRDAYRVYSMNDVPTDGTRDLGDPE